MRSGYTDRGPAWWLLYAIAGMLLGLIGLVELDVPDVGPREILEIVLVIGAFALMVIWVRFNRRQ